MCLPNPRTMFKIFSFKSLGNKVEAVLYSKEISDIINAYLSSLALLPM